MRDYAVGDLAQVWPCRIASTQIQSPMLTGVGVYFDLVKDIFERHLHFLTQCLNSPLQKRLTEKDQKISENFFARGDGTVCATSSLKLRKRHKELLHD